MQMNEKQGRYSITAARTRGMNSWFTGKAMSEQLTSGNLLRTLTTPWNLYRNTRMLTTQRNRPPRLPPTTLKLSWNRWRFPPHSALQMIAQMTSGKPIMMKNMIVAALSRTISPQIMTASYGTPTSALSTARTLE